MQSYGSIPESVSARDVFLFSPEVYMDNKELFSRKSIDYSLCRPSYPVEAVQWIRSKVSGDTVLDVGAGTGIFTKVLLPFFTDVSAIEPNKDMREEFCKFLPCIPCSGASGEDTQMTGKSIDLITVAQAFHWLDEDLFRKEAKRILKNTGKAAIIWNTSIRTDFTQARDAVCRKYCPGFRTGHAGKRSVGAGDIFLRESGYFQSVEVKNFFNNFIMDRNIFEGNMRSRSYTPYPGEKEYEVFMKDLGEVFEKFAVNGVVVEKMETQIYLGSF